MAKTSNSMTQKEFLMKVIETTVDEEIKTYAETALEKMAARLEARKDKLTPNQIANAEIKAEILKVFTVDGASPMYTAAAVGQMFEISTQKASSLLLQLEEAGELTSTVVKATSGKGKAKGYSLASTN